MLFRSFPLTPPALDPWKPEQPHLMLIPRAAVGNYFLRPLSVDLRQMLEELLCSPAITLEARLDIDRPPGLGVDAA